MALVKEIEKAIDKNKTTKSHPEKTIVALCCVYLENFFWENIYMHIYIYMGVYIHIYVFTK